MMTVLPLPVQPPMWVLGYFSISRSELHARVGAPHFTETESSYTRGGHEDVWAFVSAGGQRIMLLFDVSCERALIVADPPDAPDALAALGSATSDLLVFQFDRAYPFA